MYIGTVMWNGQYRTIEVDEAEPLTGMGLLRGHSLRMDVVEDGTVKIEALASFSGVGTRYKGNEWIAACNSSGYYWLDVVDDCATPHPRFMCVRDPFGKLLANSRTSNSYTVNAEELYGAAEQ